MNAGSSFFEHLQRVTAGERASLVSAPVIERALRGEVTLASYRAFLHEAYHHVRHTVPFLRACRARLPERLSWMHSALDEYIAEEQGHHVYRNIGALAGPFVDRAVFVGSSKNMQTFRAGAKSAGMPAEAVSHVHTAYEATKLLREEIQPGDPDYDLSENHGYMWEPKHREWPPRWLIVAITIIVIIALIVPTLLIILRA